MMLWGEFQSAIQMACGLNAAYATIPAIRAPGLGKLLRKIEEIEELYPAFEIFIHDKLYNKSQPFYEKFSKIRRYIGTSGSFQATDDAIRTVLLAAFLTNIIEILISSYNYSKQIPDWLSEMVVVSGYGPVILSTTLSFVDSFRLRTISQRLNALTDEMLKRQNQHKEARAQQRLAKGST